MAFHPLFRGWPVAKTLSGLTAVGASIVLFHHGPRGALPLSLMPEQAPPKATFRSFGPSFVRLRLQSHESTSPTTKLLRFELPPNSVSGLGLGSAVLAAAWPEGSLFPVVRPYTPVSRHDEGGCLELLVKKYPGGKMSGHLHSLKPGDTLLFPAAIPSYKWTPNKHERIVLIAGGQGITPLFQLAQGILDNPQDRTSIRLVYGVNNEAEMLFKDRFERWQHEMPGRFSVSYVVSNPAPGSSYAKGRLDADVLARLVPAARGDGRPPMQVFVCGPPAMEQSVLGKKTWFGGGDGGALGQMGYTKTQIHQF